MNTPIVHTVLLAERFDCGTTSWAVSSTTNAHYTMQIHKNCSVGECPAKTAAFGLLASEKKLVPDSGRS
ncbi:hypothetical protein [Nocardia sp. NPDC005366]|uniref:hypothetical protein n=1 Tax=Nocardia sp. NPDC005366 TaxID=3156878 RepID=UPI0033A3B4FF